MRPSVGRCEIRPDGKEYQVTAGDLSLAHTLAELLHDQVGKAGRRACGEGGCGACAVIVTRPRASRLGSSLLRLGTFG